MIGWSSEAPPSAANQTDSACKGAWLQLPSLPGLEQNPAAATFKTQQGCSESGCYVCNVDVKGHWVILYLGCIWKTQSTLNGLNYNLNYLQFRMNLLPVCIKVIVVLRYYVLVSFSSLSTTFSSNVSAPPGGAAANWRSACRQFAKPSDNGDAWAHFIHVWQYHNN